VVRRSALTLDLWASGHPDRAAPGLHANRLPGAERRRPGDQSDP
jgi:hypothetical protein